MIVGQSRVDEQVEKALTRATKVPIGMDESIHSLADIEAVKRAGAKGLSLKLIKLGGFRGTI